MRLLIIAALLAGAAAPARASASGKGTAAAAFLKIAPGARGAAMGESLGGVADDAYAAWYNPAGLGFLERVEAAAAHDARFAGVAYDAAVLAVPVLSWRDSPLRANAYGTTALSVYSLSAKGIERRGLVETDAPSGTFASSDRAYALSYGLAPGGGDWAFGGTAKFVDSALDSARATALTFDGGALWKGDAGSFGAGVRGWGGRLRYASESDPLPTAYWFGGGWRPRAEWLLTGQIDVPKQDAPSLGLGVERRWTPAPGLRAAARGGYASARSDGGGVSGLSLGFGLTWRAMEFDFAWSPSGALGDLFKYSILVRFGEGRPGGISRDKSGWRWGPSGAKLGGHAPVPPDGGPPAVRARSARLRGGRLRRQPPRRDGPAVGDGLLDRAHSRRARVGVHARPGGSDAGEGARRRRLAGAPDRGAGAVPAQRGGRRGDEAPAEIRDLSGGAPDDAARARRQRTERRGAAQGDALDVLRDASGG